LILSRPNVSSLTGLSRLFPDLTLSSAPPPSSALALTWAVSTISGYGIYGLQIILQFLRRGGQQVVLTNAPSVTEVDPLVRIKLEPIFALARKLHGFLQENPAKTLVFKHAVLHGSANDFAGFAGQDRVRGYPNVACCAIEHLVYGEHGRKVAKNYDMFIAISRWNEEFLKSLNLGPVHLRYQGIDSALFHPGPCSGLYRNRFVVFSGGKFEFRKGQDIVIAAFKRFRERHPEALLITCWQNLLTPHAAPFALAGHCQTVPEKAEIGLQLTPWLLQQGLPPESFIDLPFIHNLLMPSILRECDVAVFPNRCEGGTNLVAMEAMACGVPAYVANNTGQKDLVDLIGCGAFQKQKPVKASPGMSSVEGWGETDVEEVLEALEYVYTHRDDAVRKAAQIAEKMPQWEWGALNEKLLATIYDWKGPAS
jgi:glycosyltransferase involved in cell wall biosynthesis